MTTYDYNDNRFGFDFYKSKPPSTQGTNSTSSISYSTAPTGVWAAYTDYPTLFEADPPVVLFNTELEALRYAVKDTSRVVKVVFVPFGVSLATKLV